MLLDLDAAPDGFAVTLADLHARMRAVAALAQVTRIAVAVYDAKTDVLRTFIHSDRDNPLSHYVARLSEVPSLQAVATSGKPRVLADMAKLVGFGQHSRRLLESGFRSSYTIPLTHGAALQGFLFFNARRAHFFTPEVLTHLWPYAEIAKLIALSEVEKARLMQAAVSTLREVSHHRDEETGEHLERMSRYARLIAQAMAGDFGLSDELIELIFQFAPLHDVGKVAIPDRILLKPGPLDEAEFRIMQQHVVKGRSIIDMMIDQFGMGDMPHIGLLQNMVSCHHEAWDGSGYPAGLTGEAIPLEARIAAVADVFDALTRARSYKPAWTNDEAAAYLKRMRGSKFFGPCVDALLSRPQDLVDIQSQFAEPGLASGQKQS